MNRSKRLIYIATFIVAGEVLFGFIALLIASAWFWLLADGVVAHSVSVCVHSIKAIAMLLMIAGGFLGFAGGVHFWPVLYNDDGSLKYHTLREWRSRFGKKPSEPEVAERGEE